MLLTVATAYRVLDIYKRVRQHTATHCNTLQHTATHCNTSGLSVAHVYRVARCVAVCCSVLQCVAVCCSVLQCVAVCCSVLQCVAVCGSVLQCVCCSVLQCVAVCCSVLQCATVCYRVARWDLSECVAVCCSVLQRVAVCCSGEVRLVWDLSETCCSFDWCCLYYLVRTSLVVLLEALCARISFLLDLRYCFESQPVRAPLRNCKFPHNLLPNAFFKRNLPQPLPRTHDICNKSPLPRIHEFLTKSLNLTFFFKFLHPHPHMLLMHLADLRIRI